MDKLDEIDTDFESARQEDYDMMKEYVICEEHELLYLDTCLFEAFCVRLRLA
jgi:hypothetical protein